jgi:hypothetical protein
MRLVQFTTSFDGKTIHVNPEQVIMVRPPISEDPRAKTLLVLQSGSCDVRENLEEVMKILGA